MNRFPENIKFKYPWRKYQKKVLNDLKKHLNDDHLHIIAPPGSGKTVLGLEVAIQINKPTLILAPTISIQNQWINRFCELFLQTQTTPHWISTDIRNPKFMTVVTYQGLHAASNNWHLEDEENDLDHDEEIGNSEEQKEDNNNISKIISGLKSINIGTIVVDEAHHLKNQWWKTLNEVKKALNPKIVGLTATPPYDVTANEWKRYIELNGPVDAEISVPELIKEQNLCPHQDYIYFTFPTDNEKEAIVRYRGNIEKLYNEIIYDPTLIKAIQEHPIFDTPTLHLDWIYNNISYYSSCLIILNHNMIHIPQIHMDIIGEEKLEIPKMTYEWIAIILEFYLYSNKGFESYSDHRTLIENRLRRYGAIERKQINFSYNRRVTSFLTSSISKLNGIKQITDFEYRQLGNSLRQVILTDFIRKDYLVESKENNLELNKIGVVPIFEKLRRENHLNKKIGVLTGSIIILPKKALESFKEKAKEYVTKTINYSHLSYDENYVLIHRTEEIKHQIVHIVTQIFQKGEIEVLIGTKSLLGEGWDAPAINSLIIASFVGSFVLSNQMRGRAIRTEKGNSSKTANIWHIVCIDPTSNDGGDDLSLLKRRFRSFVGVSLNNELSIENGIGRLHLPPNIYEPEVANEINREMIMISSDRKRLIQRWENALKTGNTLVEEIKIPYLGKETYQYSKSLYFNKTIGNLLGVLASSWLTFGLESLQGIVNMFQKTKGGKEFLYYLTFIAGFGMISFSGLTIKTLKIYFK